MGQPLQQVPRPPIQPLFTTPGRPRLVISTHKVAPGKKTGTEVVVYTGINFLC